MYRIISLATALTETEKQFKEYRKNVEKWKQIDEIRAKKKERRLRRKAKGPRK